MRRNLQLILALFLSSFVASSQTPTELADAQLEAYNNRDIEAFLIPYSDSVKVFNNENELIYQGKHFMREQYSALFKKTPDLNCKLLNRIALGNTVVEHEEVAFGEGKKGFFIVMYKVRNNKIQEVYFVDRQ